MLCHVLLIRLYNAYAHAKFALPLGPQFAVRILDFSQRKKVQRDTHVHKDGAVATEQKQTLSHAFLSAAIEFFMRSIVRSTITRDCIETNALT